MLVVYSKYLERNPANTRFAVLGKPAAETEQHIWIECENIAWEAPKDTWWKTTPRDWRNISMGLIRDTASILFGDDQKQ